MNLGRKYFFSNFMCKNISSCCYLFNDTRINCVQYYTCLNFSTNVQPKVFKYKKLLDESKRTMSALQTLRETKENLTLKIKNFTDNFPSYIPLLGAKYRKHGFLWYNTLEDISTIDFFTILQLPDTFYSRFQIIELHVWMLLRHLPKEGRIDTFIRAGVINAMWQDNQSRAKMIAEINKNYKKNFRTLYGEFLLAQMFYDYCFEKSDAALASAVWCNFFNKKNVDPRLLEALVCYIRYQMQYLSKFNFADLKMKNEKPKIWAPAKPIFQELLGK